MLDAAVLVADDAEDEVVEELPLVALEGSEPVDEAMTPPAVALLTAPWPPWPPEPLPATPPEKRSSPPRPQAGRTSALARSKARRSEGRDAGIVAEIIAKKWPADKRDGDRGRLPADLRGAVLKIPGEDGELTPSSPTPAALAAP